MTGQIMFFSAVQPAFFRGQSCEDACNVSFSTLVKQSSSSSNTQDTFVRLQQVRSRVICLLKDITRPLRTILEVSLHSVQTSLVLRKLNISFVSVYHVFSMNTVTLFLFYLYSICFLSAIHPYTREILYLFFHYIIN